MSWLVHLVFLTRVGSELCFHASITWITADAQQKKTRTILCKLTWNENKAVNNPAWASGQEACGYSVSSQTNAWGLAFNNKVTKYHDTTLSVLLEVKVKSYKTHDGKKITTANIHPKNF